MPFNAHTPLNGQEDRVPLSQRRHGQMRRSCATCRQGLIWALLALELGGVGALLCAVQSLGTPAPSVVVAGIMRCTMPIYDEFVARTQALHTVELCARVQGFLEQVRFQEGALVHADQLLFVIERSPYAAALQAAKAQLATAQVDLTRAREQVEVLNARVKLAQQRASLAEARQDVARLRPLARDWAEPRHCQLHATICTMRVQGERLRR